MWGLQFCFSASWSHEWWRNYPNLIYFLSRGGRCPDGGACFRPCPCFSTFFSRADYPFCFFFQPFLWSKSGLARELGSPPSSIATIHFISTYLLPPFLKLNLNIYSSLAIKRWKLAGAIAAPLVQGLDRVQLRTCSVMPDFGLYFMHISGNNDPNKTISLKIRLIIFSGSQNWILGIEGTQLE